MYSQKDYPQQLGTCKDTIAQSGCFVTSFCNLLIFNGVEITPVEFNKKAFPKGGCLANAQYWADMYNMMYIRTTTAPTIACIAETDHYKAKGIPQHFFLYKNGEIVDPLDKKLDWKKNKYKIVSYRIFIPYMDLGVDLSHHNKVNIAELPHVDFIYHKATEGVGYTDPTYKKRIGELAEKCNRLGHYHFARPDLTGPKEEANFFYETVKDYLSPDDILVLDWERDHEQPQRWVKTFITVLEEKCKNEIMVYTGDSLETRHKIGELGYSMIIARYGLNDGKINHKYEPRNNWDVWQYTSNGRISGVDGRVDLNLIKNLPKVGNGVVVMPEPISKKNKNDTNSVQVSTSPTEKTLPADDIDVSKKKQSTLKTNSMSKVFTDPVVLGAIRHGLTTIGGGFVTAGYISEGELQTTVGAILVLLGVAASIYDKMNR